MTAPHLVPTPTSMTALPEAAFRIGSGAEITGDPAAVAALQRHLDPLPAAPSSGSIDLSVQAGGPAGSYRLAVGTASVAVTGADAAGLFAGIQTLTQLLAEGPDGWTIPAVRIDDAPRFLRDVFAEVAALTPGPYLHFGGDEALGTDPADFAEFVARASALVVATGRTPIAWHEAGAADGLAPGTIGQYWGFVSPTDGMDDKTRRFVAGGGRIILSPADAIYLDMKFDAASPLGLTWANGPTSLRRAYEWDPATVIDGIGDAEILGVEAPLWTETVRDLADIDALAFPRIAAAAEAGWSAPFGATPERTWESFRTRVAALEPLWTRLGISFTPVAEGEPA
ncbi:family 20 glycosylhydrolase [uncultured Microbacterium sp.]|uniref:family 20 glycosylhydrolase n=1 Tax=uncultured Microbacterium sp. TaxID=191216 RepID=UPI002622AC84|nr:family 20 glycosylhydrolase [uncultured Microbacterium sp.]